MSKFDSKTLYQSIGNVGSDLIEEAMGPMPCEKKNNITWLKRAGAMAASLVLVDTLLFSVNAVFPTFAEELPFIGRVFRQINKPGVSNLQDTSKELQGLAQDVKDTEVIAAAPDGTPVNVSVRGAHFDGHFLYVGLELNTKLDEYFLLDSVGCGVTLNGEDLPGLAADVTNFRWYHTGDGKYIKEELFLLPEKYLEQDSLEVTLSYNDLLDPDERTAVKAPITLTFPVSRTPVKTKAVQGTKLGGITLESAVATPTGTVFTATLPEGWENASFGARFEDGSWLGATGMKAAPEHTETGGLRIVWAEGGIREDETRKVVLTFRQDRSSPLSAVFLIDFQNGTVTPGSEEDVRTLPNLAYACGREAINTLSDGYLVSYLSVSGGSESAKMFIATPEKGYRALRVELWQGGKMLASAFTVENNGGALGFSPNYRYRDPEGDIETTLNRYDLSVNGVKPDAYRDMTVKLYDASTGELLHQQIFALTDKPVM